MEPFGSTSELPQGRNRAFSLSSASAFADQRPTVPSPIPSLGVPDIDPFDLDNSPDVPTKELPTDPGTGGSLVGVNIPEEELQEEEGKDEAESDLTRSLPVINLVGHHPSPVMSVDEIHTTTDEKRKSRRRRSSIMMGQHGEAGVPYSLGVEESEYLISIPELQAENLFLPIPPNDPLMSTISKYLPSNARPIRDTSGSYLPTDTITSLIATSSYRSLATMAHDRILSLPPTSIVEIFEMWELRLHCLNCLLLPTHHARELGHLFSVVDSLQTDLQEKIRSDFLPFSIEMMHCSSLGRSDPYLSISSFSRLLRRTKKLARLACQGGDTKQQKLQYGRACRIGISLAGVLLDLKEPISAVQLLQSLLREDPKLPSSSPNPYLLFNIAKIHFSTGNLQQGTYFVRLIEENPTSWESLKGLARGLEATVIGDNVKAQMEYSNLASEGAGKDKDGFTAANNLAVVLLGNGRLKQAISTLETAISTAPSVALTEPLLFNLATLYELRTTHATEKKVELLKLVTQQNSVIKPGCLKLQ